MRHQKRGKKLGRHSSHRKALWSNMVSSLIEYERIQTTDVKAKELRRIADRTINWSVSLGDILTRDRETLDADDKARLVHAIRMARRVLKNPVTLAKLFDDVGPRLIGRQGGFTRVLKVGNRRGDAAPVSMVELVVRSEPAASQAAPKASAKATKAAASESAPAKVDATEKPKRRATKKAAKTEE